MVTALPQTRQPCWNQTQPHHRRHPARSLFLTSRTCRRVLDSIQTTSCHSIRNATIRQKARLCSFLQFRLFCEYRPEVNNSKTERDYIPASDWNFWLSITDIQYHQLMKKRIGCSQPVTTSHVIHIWRPIRKQEWISMMPNACTTSMSPNRLSPCIFL